MPNNQFHWTTAASPVPYLRAASAKPNVPVMSSAATTRGRQLISAAYFLEDAPSESHSRRSPASNAMALSLCGLGSLQASVSPAQISLRHVAPASATHGTSNKMITHFPKPPTLKLTLSKTNRCVEDAAASIRMAICRSRPVQ